MRKFLLGLWISMFAVANSFATSYIDFSTQTGFTDAKDTLLAYAVALVGVLLVVMGLRKLNRYLSRS